MLYGLLSLLRIKPSNDLQLSRRKDDRRESDRCICFLNGQAYPIVNWSFGGVLLSADERLFALGQNINMTIKFKLRSTILDVNLKGSVVRKTQGHVGLQFESVSKAIRRNMQQVIDDQVAREFANSQV